MFVVRYDIEWAAPLNRRSVRPHGTMRKAPAVVLVGAIALLAAANWPASSGDATGNADRIVIEKGERRLTLFRGGRILKSYRVSLGRSPVGHKQREGDNRTPEGQYVIDRHNPDSAFHRALHVSYPNAADRARAAEAGVSPGGDIMIHGLPNRLAWVGRLHRVADWTAGCIAVTNPEIEEIYRAVPDGTPVETRK